MKGKEKSSRRRKRPPLTEEQIEDLARKIYKLLDENELWIDTCIYFNGKKFTNHGPDGHYYYDGSVFIETDKDPSDYFEFVNPDHILSMSFEGPVYHMFNHGEHKTVKRKLDALFAKFGVYYELGNAWNLTCYYI